MNRCESREQAFILLFESTFGFESTEEIILNAKLVRNEKVSEFSRRLFEGVMSHKELIDKYIEENSNDWKKERLSRTTISILRLAIYESIITNETPIGVAANEAVELAKKYSTLSEASYINGVLGAIGNKK